MGTFTTGFDSTNYPHETLDVAVDGLSVLKAKFEAVEYEQGKGAKFGTLQLNDDQEELLGQVFYAAPPQLPLQVLIEEIEVPYIYTWASGKEAYDGSILFSIPITPQDVVKIQVAFGERDAFKNEFRKRLLFVTKIGAHSDSRLRPRHGDTTIAAEFTGEDGYPQSRALVSVIRKKNARDYYIRSDYPDQVHPALQEFVSVSNGVAQTQSDFIQGAWDRIVCRAALPDFQTMLRFAFVKTLLLS